MSSNRTLSDERSRSGSLFNNLNYLLQDFYLLRRRIRVTYDVGALGISEAQILVQTLAEPGLTSKRLSEVLQLEKSTISRIIGQLIEKGHLETRTGEIDAREKQLFISSSGKKLVSELQESNNEILRQCLKNLTAKEQFDLAHGMRLLADGLGCSAATYLPGDHPVTLEIVRLGRGMGMTGTAFWDTEISSTQYHFLRAVHEGQAASLSEMQRVLPFDASTLSRTAASLRERGLLTQQQTEDAKKNKVRGLNFELTEAGRTILMSTDKTAEKIIAKALADHPLEAAENLRTLLEKISAPEGRHMKKILQERVEIRPLQSLQDRQLARGLLLDALIRSNRHFETPDEMYSPNNLCYGLFMEDRLVAACEVLGQGAEAKTINTTYIPQLEPLLLKSFQDTIEAQRDKDR